MIQRTTISILALSLVAFLGGLVGSMQARSQEAAPPEKPPCVDAPRWGGCLGVGPERMAEIEARDPAFRTELDNLRTELAGCRERLAELFNDAESADEDIRAAVELIIDARARLERRVTEHLLLVRSELDPRQQQKLFDILAEGVRGHHGMGWGRGEGRGVGRGGRVGDRPERGDWGDRGAGRGRGHGREPGRGGGWNRARGTTPDGEPQAPRQEPDREE
ncbi:MAG TPA: hypothetical protein VM243_11725 [Phycisphaerae bacterium]|nr:hypothetical protein [Phycisphaerae bacterium]